MKILKTTIWLFLCIGIFAGCEEDDFVDVDFAKNIVAPENVGVHFVPTQDNSGMVHMTPYADNATHYTINYGDSNGTTEEEISVGETVSFTYTEGSYDITVEAFGMNNTKTTEIVPLEVSFNAPEIKEFTIENDEFISKQVNVTVDADYAISFDVDFGETEDQELVSANIGETASFKYTDAGTYEITITVKGTAIETTTITETFEVTKILQPAVKAPTPTVHPNNVKSIFSDAYPEQAIGLSEVNPGWGQSTVLNTIEIEGDNVWKFDLLNFSGIVTDYGNPTNLSDMTHVHIDYWTPDAENLKIKLVNTVLKDTDGAPQDVYETEVAVGEITKDEWVSVDLDLSLFEHSDSNYGALLEKITQIILSSSSATVFVDNFYFYTATPSAPSIEAPMPTANPNNVISIYSDAYPNQAVALSEVNPGWGQQAVLSDFPINGNNIWKYQNLDFSGIVTNYGDPTNLSEMTHVHLDYWTPDAESLKIKLVNTVLKDVDGAPQEIYETEVAAENIVIGEWGSVDLDLSLFEHSDSNYSAMLEKISQIILSSSGATVFIDNFYFYKTVANAPTTEAPIPTKDANNVISIYSDAYPNQAVALSEVNPGWGQQAVLSDFPINGNNTWKYENLDFSGIVTNYGDPTNLSEMTHLHLDYWSPDAESLKIKLVNTVLKDVDGAPQEIYETEVAAENIVNGEWGSVDLDLSLFEHSDSNFSAMLEKISQIVLSSSGATVYVDNFYFYKESTEVPTAPTTEAPIPTTDSSNVISIYSDAYPDQAVALSDVNPGWGQAAVLSDYPINGNNIWKYENLDFSGIVTNYGDPTNLSGMTHVHLDYWTPDAESLKIKLVNTVLKDVDGAPQDIYETEVAIGDVTKGSWTSVDLDLSLFEHSDSNYSAMLEKISQIILSSSGATVYIDNFYFYNQAN